MIPPPFRYHRATSAAEAATLLGETPGSVLLAGGQSLVNALKLDLVAPTAVIDIHRLEELRRVRADGSSLTIGAAVTYAELSASEIVRLQVASLANACAALVDRQVRNRGTIGGNVCLNDPTSNLPPLLAALDAKFEVLSTDGAATYGAGEFFTGTMSTAAAGGVLTSISVPVTPSQVRVSYRHQQVGADSWAIARVVGAARLTKSGLSDVRLLLAAVPGSPVRLTEVEAVLEGRNTVNPHGPSDGKSDLVESALAAFDDAALEFVGDAHGSAVFRRHLARVQLKRWTEDIIKQEAAA